MSTPVSLTAISGGINRLRTKGGADKNSLFDLLNGYVTQAGTVKVREGTYRNANIATYSGAGKTKGLMAYQGELHVFSDAVVAVPPGYALHVLNHPAAQQTVIESNVLDVTVTQSSQSDAQYPYSGTWETAGVGYGATGIGSGPYGSISTQNINGLTLEVCGATNTQANFNPFVNNAVLLIQMAGSVPRNSFTSVTITKTGGSPQTFQTATSDYFNPTNFGSGSQSSTLWGWNIASAAALFANGVGTTVLFNAAGVTVTTVTPIPIKEINFAAPYLGGVYVSATFNVTDPAVLAQWGDTFHFWIQSSAGSDTSNTWMADTDYQIGDVVIPSTVNGLTYVASRRYPANPVWAPSVIEVIGNIVEPTVANGFQYTATATLGLNPTTGLTEPVWPTSDGATVQENSSVANDQTITRVTAANSVPTPQTPPRYSGSIAGGFEVNG